MELGTFIYEDHLRGKLRITGPGKVSFAVQWVIVRTWTWPDVPTIGDIEQIRLAFGLGAILG